MTEQKAYRIVEMRYGAPCTLFHGLPGTKRSRRIPLDTWLAAEKKPVSYGRSSPTMISGFNVLMDRKECEDYLSRFTADRKLLVVEILVRGLREKPNANSPVFLADWMLLPATSINRR